MTKENFTSINVIIDRSGSMGTLTQDTIGSFNTFLKEQKDVPGEAAPIIDNTIPGVGSADSNTGSTK